MDDKMEDTTQKIMTRSEQRPEDCWKLESLFESDAAWETEFSDWEKSIDSLTAFRGKLGESVDTLRSALDIRFAFMRREERLGTYAFLRFAEDQTNDDAQQRQARFGFVAAKAGEATAYMQPELLSIPEATMQERIATPELAPYKTYLQRLERKRPHTLSEKEERILAMQAEMSDTAAETFRQLNDSDLKFGSIDDGTGCQVEVSHGTYATLLNLPNREVRRNLFETYYRAYHDHQYTFAATLNGLIRKDTYYSRVRNFDSALDDALFPDAIPTAVYNNLVQTIHQYMPTLYRYYEVRRRAMKLDDIHFYDIYAPILSDLTIKRSFDEAITMVTDSFAPLGEEYVTTCRKGLTGGWCDRYENRGKQSGAFSCGSFDGQPYILMNYQDEVFDNIFTLAHEAGHSMHSWYSSKTQPFPYYDYSLFLAEIASTFNEQILSDYLQKHAKNERELAYLINHELDGIRQTIFRQTMFAEFERTIHTLGEAGEALTADRFRSEYRKVLDLYFGPNFVIDEPLSLECFRIPHFYRSYYVYQYATGMSAAIALSQMVLNGGEAERERYLGFLKSGSSKMPLEILKDAGLDMSQPAPIEAAMKRFAALVDQLDGLL
ncbi:MAG: oligoendopeptidase F [Thermoguttaceae bacterium]|nr:oligoendopeptidase F [Thermoguttaceae bacterium]